MKTYIHTLAAIAVFAATHIAQAQDAGQPTLQQKLDAIILPKAQFTDATIGQALEYFRVKSRELDSLSVAPAQKGVSIVLKPGGNLDAKITLNLTDTPLLEALRHCADLAGLQQRVEAHAVVFAPNFDPVPAPPEAAAPPVIDGADQIIVPRVQFRDATLLAAVEYARVKSRVLVPDKQGINIVIKPGGADVRISLDLCDIPLPHLLLYIAELSQHHLTTDAHSYLLIPIKAE